MTRDRIAQAALAALCLAGLGACSGTRDVSDAELTRLLHTEQSSAADANAPLDPAAVHCLRAWSDDPGLTTGLSPAVTSEAGKKGCRERIDGWLADADRNPDKLSFEDVSTPKAAGRASALLAAHHPTEPLPSAAAQPPAEFQPKPAMEKTLPTPTTPASPADVSAANAAVDELEGLCQQANVNATKNPRVGRYAKYCDQRVKQLRARVRAAEASGDARQIEIVTRNAQNVLSVGRRLSQMEQQREAGKSQ